MSLVEHHKAEAASEENFSLLMEDDLLSSQKSN